VSSPTRVIVVCLAGGIERQWNRVNLEPCRLIFLVSMETMTQPEVIHHLWPQMCKWLDPQKCFHFYFLHIQTLCQAAPWLCGAHINYEPWLSCRAFNHNDLSWNDFQQRSRLQMWNINRWEFKQHTLPPPSARNVSFSCYNMTVHSPCVQADELDTGHKRVKKALSNSSYKRLAETWWKLTFSLSLLSISLLSDHEIEQMSHFMWY